MFITGYEARPDRSYVNKERPGSYCSLKLEGYVTIEEMCEIDKIFADRKDVSFVMVQSEDLETPSEAPAAGTMGEMVLAGGSTRAAKTSGHTIAPHEGAGTGMPSLEEMSQYGGPLPAPPSIICPCGLTRTDCEYHR